MKIKRVSAITSLIILLLLFYTFKITALEYEGSGSGSSTPTQQCAWDGCWYNQADMGFRFTIVDDKHNKLANTSPVDYFTNTSSKNSNSYINITKYFGEGNTPRNDGITLSSTATGYASSDTTTTVENIIDDILEASGFNGYYQEGNLHNKYIVVEPLYYIGYGNPKVYKIGTAYEIASGILKSNQVSGLCNSFLYNIASNMYLGEAKIDYKAVSVDGWLNADSDIPFGNRQGYIDAIADQSNGYGKHVVRISDVKPIREDKSCTITASLNNCGESNISESTDSSCIIGNSVYSYLSSCNLYCSDKIETDFSNFYKTFIGNNKFNAIPSGRYLSIKGNPTITITKTCYQSSAAAECPNVTDSFSNKLIGDYKNNNIILNVDGNSYTLIGTPTINNTDYSSATITYEYKLDDNVNKYISIETMKGETLTETNKKIVIMNGTPMIITKKDTYGTYNYSLDVSGTVLNKYVSSDSAFINLSATSSNDKYIFQNKIKISYNGEDRTTYINSDLNYSCSYSKYDSLEGCICPEDTVCNSITCEPVDSPCVCDGECGCYDTKDCKPIPCPPPTTEKPDVVYRPISLTNPFPGINGTTRDPGRNWLGLVRDKDGNLVYYKGSITSLSDYYIKYNRGYTDYELYREAEPLYVIKLDSDRIKAIREYNDYKNHDYNNFDLECTNGEKCISKFLRGTAPRFSINLIESGTCKHVTPSTFNSCITRKN